MTVISTNVSVTYVSTGSVGPFAFNFSISTAAALKVIVNNTVLSSTAYTVTPVNNNYANGGSVLLVAPPTVGVSIVLQRSTPLTQASVYADNIPKPMQTFEASLDKLTEITQELAANQSGSGSGSTYVTAGTGIVVTGTGTLTDPYIISTTGAPLSIASFTSGFAAELGQNVINPGFAATYTGTPTSASITNTDSIASPTNLTTPFTSATLVGTFTHSTPATVTFTLHASDGVSNPTATVTGSWAERIFGGVGAPGATSTVTASGTTAVLSTTDALPSAGLGVETVGEMFGPYTPSGQCVYLLLSGGTHTFTDNITGFPFAFNAPIAVAFVNQYGVSLSMFLYQSVNPLIGTFEPKVTS
jgi:hypothetical protein